MEWKPISEAPKDGRYIATRSWMPRKMAWKIKRSRYMPTIYLKDGRSYRLYGGHEGWSNWKSPPEGWMPAPNFILVGE